MRPISLLSTLLLLGCANAPAPFAGTDNPFSADAGNPDGTTRANEAGASDGSSTDGNSSTNPEGGVLVQGACSAGAHACNGNLVEVCNSSGTAWLYSSTCQGTCGNGLCAGACTPGDQRCNGNSVEACNAGGTAWTTTTACSTTCSTLGGGATCTLAGVNITTNTNLDGIVVVDGDFTVFDGATLTSLTGNLSIYAKNITVQSTGSIVIAPTGQSTEGTGTTSGGYGTGGYGSPPFGSRTDSSVQAGSPASSATGVGGSGGGVVRMYATSSLSILGQVHADGAAASYGGSQYYGGSGGGILLAGNTVSVTGSVTATTPSTYYPGGYGRIKVLAASTPIVSGISNSIPQAAVTVGLLPPIPVTSTSHPDPTKIYNDDFPSFDFSWDTPFSGTQGFYATMTQTETVPTAATAPLVMKNFLSYPQSTLQQGGGSVFFNIVPIDASSNIGLIETAYSVKVNTAPPSITSTTHPSQTVWSTNMNPLFAWTFPIADSNLTRSYYVLDHYGNTVPDSAATLLPITQKQLLLSNLAAGVWVFHVVSVDTRGYFTKVAGNYRINLGADPGTGSIVGHVFDALSKPIVGATVTVNHALYSQISDSGGNFNFGSIPVGTWEVDATSQGKTTSQMVSVTASGVVSSNFTL